MTRISSVVAYNIAVACGVALWVSISRISGLPEAWDSGLYYVYGIPITMVVSFALGYSCSRNPWRWPLTIMVSQALVAIIQNPMANLLPLGLIAFGVLAVPGLLSAYLGAFLRNKYKEK
jgi:hypothetical protein